jgi:hypothetical protein
MDAVTAPEAAPADAVGLTLALDKKVYQPGEAVLATVALTNQAGRTMTIRTLDAASVSFWFGRLSDEERMRREAVVSDQEPLDRTESIAPGQRLERRFVLTGLTQYGGAAGGSAFHAQAHYEFAGGEAPEELPRIFSNAVDFEVKGARIFRRDAGGLILKEDAIAQAARTMGGAAPAAAEALLVRDEMGFAKWWVNLTLNDAAGAAVTRGAFVDPYRGVVWTGVRPFNPAERRDPHRLDPASLPPAMRGSITGPRAN